MKNNIISRDQTRRANYRWDGEKRGTGPDRTGQGTGTGNTEIETA